MNKTSIGWTDYTSNPIRARSVETGKAGHFCEKVSPGCAHCYASEWNENRYGTGVPFLPANRDKVDFYLNETELREWSKPKYAGAKVFVCDMTDLFGEWVPDHWIIDLLAGMERSPATFQLLTKRPARMREMITRFCSANLKRTDGSFGLIPNVWLGVSVENQHWLDQRVPYLLETPAAIRFLSLEPLLGSIDLSRWLSISWCIAGGESAGPAYRSLVSRVEVVPVYGPERVEWSPKKEALAAVRSLRDQCVDAGVAFFFKQWGGPRPTSAGRLLDGRTWDEYPR